jgi:aspartate ammonia-lyase
MPNSLKKMRTETDFIGSMEIPRDALYGIHSLRAVHNFPDKTPFHLEWYQAAGTVKKACYITYARFADSFRTKHPGAKLAQPLIEKKTVDALIAAATEVEDNQHAGYFIVPAIQGGAGTSINMNVNEIIANRALIITGHLPGEYTLIDPVEHANICQSTNDVIPTSLRIALFRLFSSLEESINRLRLAMEEQEKGSRQKMRIAYTQMQEAVPSSYGRLLSTYCDALSRDWWRVSKCFERIKTVNLGGSAIGTGITVPRFFMSGVVQTLREITGMPFTRAENLQDATCNLDALVEVHAILKAHAVNLEKMVSDLRLLSSDLLKRNELQIPQLQVGSSVMPGKVNPVVPEFVVSAAHKIYSNDQLISGLCALGCLDLNAYIPTIGHALIESIKLMIACDETICVNLVEGLQINGTIAGENLSRSAAISTALLPYIGYNQSARLAYEMKNKHISIIEANRLLNIMPEEKLLQIIQPDNLLKEGFNMQDIIEQDGKGKGE